MTKAELIEALKDFPDDWDVCKRAIDGSPTPFRTVELSYIMDYRGKSIPLILIR